MKKLLIIALVFITSSFCTPSSSYYATTWAGTAANQGVTYAAFADAMNTGVFPYQCLPSDYTGGRLIKKTDLNCVQNINIESTALAAKTDNQIIVKSDFVYYENSLSCVFGNPTAFTTCYDASYKTSSTSFFTIYYNGTFAVGTRFKSNFLFNAANYYAYTSTTIGWKATLINSTYRLYEVTEICAY